MIERYTLVKLADAHIDERAEIAQQMQWTVVELPGVAEAVVGMPADESAQSWDLSMHIRCNNLDAWYRVASTNVFLELLAFVEARAVTVKAWTFESIPR
jgi:hypothetical protein